MLERSLEIAEVLRGGWKEVMETGSRFACISGQRIAKVYHVFITSAAAAVLAVVELEH